MKTVTVLYLLSSAALAATLSACKPAGDKASADGSVASAEPGSLEGATRGDSTMMMGGAGGMTSMAGMTSAGAMDSMQTRLRVMDMMSAAQIEAALPAHSQVASDMLSMMSADVQAMHVSPNTSWSATTDSIRQDLSHMTGLTGAQMKAAMPAYHARMTRLMDMHRQMMAKTKTP